MLSSRNASLEKYGDKNNITQKLVEYLGSEALSIYFHHILAKEKYPEACLDLKI
jgi:hypothetical protein